MKQFENMKRKLQIENREIWNQHEINWDLSNNGFYVHLCTKYPQYYNPMGSQSMAEQMTERRQRQRHSSSRRIPMQEINRNRQRSFRNMNRQRSTNNVIRQYERQRTNQQELELYQYQQEDLEAAMQMIDNWKQEAVNHRINSKRLNRKSRQRRIKEQSSNKNQEETDACAICFVNNPPVRPKMCPHCLNYWCLECIAMWLREKSSCPMCRKSLHFQDLITRKTKDQESSFDSSLISQSSSSNFY